MKSRVTGLIATLAFVMTFNACDDSVVGADDEATAPLFKKGGGSGRRTVTIAMSGDLEAAAQAVSGKNDSRTLSAKGDYTLTMRLDLGSLVCGDLPGSIPDEPGLVAFVQGQTPLQGSVDIKYEKTGPDAGRVDIWTTTIGQYKYQVQFFRWASAELTQTGVTTVGYRGGSVMVFKMKGKRLLSREQCFGSFADYDLTAN